jgi:two-component system, NarL family, invasion response regulator UvrY
VQIFIASADTTFRLALLLLLESEPGMAVIGMSDRSEGLFTTLEALHPEVLLFDDELARQSAVALVNDLHHLERHPKIIVLSIHPHAKHASLAAGADGFISKTMPPDELLPLLRKMRSSGRPPTNGSD